MINPFPKSRVYGAVVCLIVMIVLAASLMYVLHMERSKITNSADTHAVEDTKIADMLKVARFAKENMALVQDISYTFQSATDTVAIIEEIEKVGAETGVSLKISKADKARGDNGIDMLAIAAVASGSWEHVYTFVAEIDALPYKHETNKIALSKVTGDDGALFWSVTIEINIPLAKK